MLADKKNWLQLLAYMTGSINQELLLRNEYLAAENHILKSQIKGRLRLSDGERATLARPRLDATIEELVVKLARENSR